jgi:hypothetical protein
MCRITPSLLAARFSETCLAEYVWPLATWSLTTCAAVSRRRLAASVSRPTIPMTHSLIVQAIAARAVFRAVALIIGGVTESSKQMPVDAHFNGCRAYEPTAILGAQACCRKTGVLLERTVAIGCHPVTRAKAGFPQRTVVVRLANCRQAAHAERLTAQATRHLRTVGIDLTPGIADGIDPRHLRTTPRTEAPRPEVADEVVLSVRRRDGAFEEPGPLSRLAA